MARTRLKVLSALDTTKMQYYHFKAIIIAGMGLFTDAYDLFSITLITKMLGRIYYSDRPNGEQYSTPPVVVFGLVVVALIGTAIKQLVFGRLGHLKLRVSLSLRNCLDAHGLRLLGLWLLHLHHKNLRSPQSRLL